MSSELKTNKVSPATGTAFTLGDSGDTFTLPSGGTLTVASGATLTNSASATGFGKVLQVVSDGTSTAASSSSGTYADTGLSVSITPSSTSSKILIIGTQADCYKDNSDLANAIHLRLMRDSTEILDICDQSLDTRTFLEFRSNISFNYLDSPSTTSATTYKTQFHNQGSWASVSVQEQGAGRSTITVLEISG